MKAGGRALPEDLEAELHLPRIAHARRLAEVGRNRGARDRRRRRVAALNVTADGSIVASRPWNRKFVLLNMLKMSQRNWNLTPFVSRKFL